MKKNTTQFLWWLVPMLGGCFIWIYQIYYWLRYAEWNGFSLLWPLSFYETFQNWVYYPTSWIGFHKTLNFIPLSIVLIIIGVLIFLLEESVARQAEYEAHLHRILKQEEK